MKTKLGRPPLKKSLIRGKPLRIRLRDSERRLIDKAANLAGLSSSEWARTLLLQAANND